MTEKPFIRSEEPEKKGRFSLPKKDKVDIITVFILLFFIISVFQLISFLVSENSTEQTIAIRSLAIALIMIAGLSFKLFTDRIGLTQTKYVSLGGKHMLSTFLFFGLAFGIQYGIGWATSIATPGAFIGIPFLVYNSVIISAISEEFLFSYAITSIASTRLTAIGGLILSTGVFVLYHTVIYEAAIGYLIYILLMRLNFGIIYLVSRNLNSVILAHTLNNILSAQSLIV